VRVIVVPYSEEWPRLFREEADRIREALGDEVVEVHHIGSTSVPGLQAKPVIDLMPVVRDIARVDAYNGAMAALGYEGLGENGIPGRRFFRKGGDERTHNVHVFQVGDLGVERHLAFRAYLVAHPEVAVRYGALKADLARRFPEDIEGYMDGKDAFVKEVERQALAWYRDARP
jgi:GrpB-like predicted nucleotidyltransferase (UPF0157 family)